MINSRVSTLVKKQNLTMLPIVQALARVPSFRLFLSNHGSKALKYFVFLVFLLNIRSWPIVWHLRVFLPAIQLQLRWWLFRVTLLPKPPHLRRQLKTAWLGALSPVGQNPFEYVDAWKTWASLDDCDYNMHLSNSCYPKILDCARLETALKCFPTLFRAGGWMALGGTHFQFLREIPIFSQYELRLSIASWDSKWFYIIIKYVSHPRKKAKGRSSRPTKPTKALTPAAGIPKPRVPSASEMQLPPTPPEDARTGVAGAPYPSVHTPAVPELSMQDEDKAAAARAQLLKSAKQCPPTPVSPTSMSPAVSVDNVREGLRAKAAADIERRTAAVLEEPDGAVVHCVALNTMCFKVGRITIPPALALALDGFSAGVADLEPEKVAASTRAPPAPYTIDNPPPWWHHVLKLRGGEPDRLREIRKFYAGGWRDVPEGERWWEQALGGEVERRRLAGLEVVGALRKVMDGAQAL